MAPVEGRPVARARRAAGHGHGDCPRRASQPAAGRGLIRQSFLPGPESGLGSATGPLGGVLRPARFSGGGSGAVYRRGLEWPPQSPVANLLQSEHTGHRGRAPRPADALRLGGMSRPLLRRRPAAWWWWTVEREPTISCLTYMRCGLRRTGQGKLWRPSSASSAEPWRRAGS